MSADDFAWLATRGATESHIEFLKNLINNLYWVVGLLAVSWIGTVIYAIVAIHSAGCQ